MASVWDGLGIIAIIAAALWLYNRGSFGITPPALGATGAGTWQQNPSSSTPCGMIGTACPTAGATSPDGWCVCQAATSTATSSTSKSTSSKSSTKKPSSPTTSRVSQVSRTAGSVTPSPRLSTVSQIGRTAGAVSPNPNPLSHIVPGLYARIANL